jgi:hypothetical protein
MRSPSVRWPPRPGDRVRIRASRLAATVSLVEGKGYRQLFILSVDGPAMRIAYRLDELEPAHHP